MDSRAHTFLFADLVGFTALAEAEGDDRAMEVAVALQRRVQGLLEEHSAEQVKTMGDGLMLRCDDPAAAVRLALRVVEDLGEEGAVPPVRFGIHTGPALAREGDWYGRTVNVAARLCAVAPGGEVMVSEDTRVAAGEIAGVSWGEREIHWLRNVAEPVGTYLASPQGASDDRASPQGTSGGPAGPRPASGDPAAPRRASGTPPASGRTWSRRVGRGLLCPRNLIGERL